MEGMKTIFCVRISSALSAIMSVVSRVFAMVLYSMEGPELSGFLPSPHGNPLGRTQARIGNRSTSMTTACNRCGRRRRLGDGSPLRHAGFFRFRLGQLAFQPIQCDRLPV